MLLYSAFRGAQLSLSLSLSLSLCVLLVVRIVLQELEKRGRGCHSVKRRHLENTPGQVLIRAAKVVASPHCHHGRQIGREISAGGVLFFSAVDAKHPNAAKSQNLRHSWPAPGHSTQEIGKVEFESRCV